MHYRLQIGTLKDIDDCRSQRRSLNQNCQVQSKQNIHNYIHWNRINKVRAASLLDLQALLNISRVVRRTDSVLVG